jgi:hypothetical protein
MSKYTAKIYHANDEIEDCTGDDLDELYTWMLAQAEGKFGSVRGEIIDNKTNKVVKQFRKAPFD